MREIGYKEFVRRTRWSVEEYGIGFVLFLGAGCSVSSGIPAASDLARKWLKKLWELEVGDEMPYDQWIIKRFPGITGEDAAQNYKEVAEKLFLFGAALQKEIDTLVSGVKPSPGYLHLAGLMSNPSYSRFFHTAITTNFDNLLEEAINSTSGDDTSGLAGRTRPQVIKLAGGDKPYENTAEMPEGILAESGLIFIGYGGNDRGVGRMLGELPDQSPAGGIYWVNLQPPGRELRKWLEERNAVWVKHSDFEELMAGFDKEFGITASPKTVTVKDLEKAMLKGGYRSSGQMKKIKLELYFFRYAFSQNDLERKYLLEKINDLINEGIRSDSPDLKEKTDEIINNGHPDPTFLENLCKVVVGDLEPAESYKGQSHSQPNLGLSWLKN